MSRSKHSHVRHIALIGTLLVGIGIVRVTIVVSESKQLSSTRQQAFQSPEKPTPSLPMANRTYAGGTTLISFPTYDLSLNIPGTFLMLKEIYPSASFTQVSHNAIVLYSSDSSFGTQSGHQNKGVLVAITIRHPWKEFSRPETLGNPRTIVQDNSIIPATNPLVTIENARVYSSSPYGDTPAWLYFAEIRTSNYRHDRSRTQDADISMVCQDFDSYSHPSMLCQRIVKSALSTLTIR